MFNALDATTYIKHDGGYQMYKKIKGVILKMYKKVNQFENVLIKSELIAKKKRLLQNTRPDFLTIFCNFVDRIWR